MNVGSTSGVMTSPFAGVYCSTKSAVHALNDAMRMELAPFGIKVVRVEPNQIRTNFGDTAAAGLAARVSADSRYVKVLDAMNARAQGSQSENAMPADEFARKVADAVLSENPPVRLRLGRELWPYTVFKPFLPVATHRRPPLQAVPAEPDHEVMGRSRRVPVRQPERPPQSSLAPPAASAQPPPSSSPAEAANLALVDRVAADGDRRPGPRPRCTGQRPPGRRHRRRRHRSAGRRGRGGARRRPHRRQLRRCLAAGLLRADDPGGVQVAPRREPVGHDRGHQGVPAQPAWRSPPPTSATCRAATA